MMSRRVILRLSSLLMLAVAVIFVICALTTPTLGSVFYIFGLRVGVEAWRVFYLLYIIVMIILFVVSFAVKKR